MSLNKVQCKYEPVFSERYKLAFPTSKIEIGLGIHASDQSLSFPPEETLDPRLLIEHPPNSLISLPRCAG